MLNLPQILWCDKGLSKPSIPLGILLVRKDLPSFTELEHVPILQQYSFSSAVNCVHRMLLEPSLGRFGPGKAGKGIGICAINCRLNNGLG